MKPGLVKTTYRRAIRRAARTALVGRLRDRERHEEGRFTRAEVDELLKQTWIAYDQLASDLCIETWCNLDFPLAEMWGGGLSGLRHWRRGVNTATSVSRPSGQNEMSITDVPGA
jgi:hypothetical protein